MKSNAKIVLVIILFIGAAISGGIMIRCSNMKLTPQRELMNYEKDIVNEIKKNSEKLNKITSKMEHEIQEQMKNSDSNIKENISVKVSTKKIDETNIELVVDFNKNDEEIKFTINATRTENTWSVNNKAEIENIQNEELRNLLKQLVGKIESSISESINMSYNYKYTSTEKK